jgi:FkbM family methyltransferase
MSYKDLLKIRDTRVYNNPFTEWVWPAEDNGAWDGPVADFTMHFEKYKQHIRKWDVVVQAGGNCGLYPRLFAEHFKYVYTFEPDPLNFHCLVNNCQLDNVIKINAALGDSNKLIRVQRAAMNNVGMHKVTTETPNDQELFIPMFTIDQLALTQCDLIQLDVEGYEANIIAGAFDTISRLKPLITCENGNNNIAEILAPYGYERVDQSHSDSYYKTKD